MTWWVTVAAVRIHGWIQQTPKLSHMRGASRALSVRTSPAVVEALVDVPTVRVQRRESEVDGVVVAAAPDIEAACTYAGRLVAALTGQLPGVQWESWWCEADSYVAAFSRAVDPFDDGVKRLRRLPALHEAGPVMSCLMCRSEPAGRAGNRVSPSVIGDDKPGALDSQGCGCQVRHDEGTFDKTDLPPDDLRAQIRGRTLAKDFAELASLGGVTPGASKAIGRKESRSHLSTVYADGNGMGAFFQALSSTSLTLPELHGAAISELNNATKDAVIQAAWAVAADPDVASIEPHFVGGDDVLVSVPAPYGWTFAAHLAGFFEGLRGTLTTLLDKDLASSGPEVHQSEEVRLLRERIAAISLGVGVTFAHASYPFAEASHAAEGRLRRAKQEAGGQYSCIAWVDITAQSAARREHNAHVVKALDARNMLSIPPNDPRAKAVFRLTPSARSQLAAILRDEDGTVAQTALETWAKRLKDTNFAEQLMNTAHEQLWADLSMARWWPNATWEEDE